MKYVPFRSYFFAPLLSLALILVASFSLSVPSQAQNKYISIGTGGPTGVYFLAGNAICRMINKAARNGSTGKIPLRCAAPSTGGSIYNINSLGAGDLDFGVAQSDWQYHAYNGTSKFQGKKQDKLRAVFSIHPEPFQIIVSKNSKIANWADLKGKRVNIGNPGSGQRGTFEELLAAYGASKSYFGQVSELTSTEQSGALCNGNIDAFGYSVGFPNSGVAQATDGCGAQIIPLNDGTIKQFISSKPYYSYVRIPRGTYSTVKADVMTFGVRATLVTREGVSEDIVYSLVKSVFENINEFKRLHPAFRSLNIQSMIRDGLSVPLHPGAAKYYKERGWL